MPNIFTLLTAIVLLGSSNTLPAQDRASEIDQRAIELAAAHSLRDSIGNVDLSQFAIDPRLYVRPIPTFGGTSVLSPTFEPRSEVYRGHTREHLDDLAKVLRTDGVLNDGDLCAPLYPDFCRYRNHAGLINFTAAWLQPDGTARIVVSLWLRTVKRDPKSGVSNEVTSMYQEVLTLARREGGWVVRNRTVVVI